jgi:succinoglycan biosynthesis transport protein ExoP
VQGADLIHDPEFGQRLSLAEKARRALGLAAALIPAGETLVQDVLARFSAALNVRRRGLTYLVAISVDAAAPDRAARLANAVVDAYVASQVDAKVQGALAARDKLQAQLDQLAAAITSADQEIGTYVEANLARIAVQTGRGDLLALRQRLEAARKRSAEAALLADDARKALAQQDWDGLTRRLADQALDEMQRQRTDLEIRLGNLPASSPQAGDLQAALADLAARQDSRAREVVAGVEGQRRAAEQELSDTRSAIRGDLLGGEVPADVARQQYQTLLSRLREIETQAAVAVPDSRVVSRALAPRVPSAPDRVLVLFFGLIGGLGLGLGLAYLVEFYVGGITSTHQLADVFGQTQAVGLPFARPAAGDDPSLADSVVREPLGGYAEAIRMLRATLELSGLAPGRRGDLKGEAPVVLVTSSVASEGKTTLALALARSFARAGLHVGLIDADLRKPGLARQAAVAPVLGLADWLADPGLDADGSGLFVKDLLSPAYLVPGMAAGQGDSDRLLASDAFAALLDSARQSFDLVFVDAPPVLAAVDTRYLARKADFAVMVVRFGTTGQSDLRSALALLRGAMKPGAEVLTVLSHQPAGAADYRGPAYVETRRRA